MEFSSSCSNLLLVLGTSLLCGGIANIGEEQKYDREGEGENNGAEEEAVIGFWSGFAWLAGMTVFIALLSEYVVDTIEDASDSWGLSVSFLSIILLPIVGNAAEHAGAIIFAFKNKLDISLGVALGSSTQIAMFVVPLCVTVSWGMGVNMDLNFNLLETGSLAVAIIVTSFTLQVS
ncbi:Vacuolar cation/proton exchanger 3 [Lathyrus oleraceus]|uniref:Vacuolar cation/proton exchanger 3 n=1 Tax=Pisum sativum TaxID=3888 RepID=A0A9D5ARQ3_PEA|nr:Vacuolar cation/proton exchanger 3 [Pisum sativum]